MEERIEKDQWAAFLTAFNHMHHGDEACIEINGREFGDQDETAWLPLSGISYDPHTDQIIVIVGGISHRYPVHLTHRIAGPTQLMVSQTAGDMESTLRIVAPDQTETLVHFRRSLQRIA